MTTDFQNFKSYPINFWKSKKAAHVCNWSTRLNYTSLICFLQRNYLISFKKTPNKYLYLCNLHIYKKAPTKMYWFLHEHLLISATSLSFNVCTNIKVLNWLDCIPNWHFNPSAMTIPNNLVQTLDCIIATQYSKWNLRFWGRYHNNFASYTFWWHPLVSLIAGLNYWLNRHFNICVDKKQPLTFCFVSF